MTKQHTTISARKNLRVVLGVTGGIAAYKSPDLVRRLRERGAEVRVVMTAGAEAFITPLTLQAVSGHAVHRHLLDADAESGMGHIELARWAELIIVAPASADSLSRLAYGRADDLLAALILASEAELAIAPAMNRQMWRNVMTQRNLQILKQRGATVVGPDDGSQACGDVGPGRMAQPSRIVAELLGEGLPKLLAGKNVVVTAGPTWEALDPVRGITNHSSGKMGFALAQAACDFGAGVHLIAGPVRRAAGAGVQREDVTSARQMYDAVMRCAGAMDIFIGVAAVADYRPANIIEQKIKKRADQMTVRLVKNPDILAEVGALNPRPYTVGFAAETENMIENGRRKLVGKNADLIVANSVAGEDGAFGNECNTATLIFHDDTVELPRLDKYALAVRIIRHIAARPESTA